MSLARKSEDILLSLLIQVVYFREVPTALTLFGAVLILICTLLLGFRKLAESKAQPDRCTTIVFCLRNKFQEV